MKNCKVYRDRQGRNCIKLRERGGSVYFVPIPKDGHFELSKTSPEGFKQRYKALPYYLLKTAVNIFKNMALIIGATDGVVEELSSMIEINEQERQTIRGQMNESIKRGTRSVGKSN